MAHLLYGFVTVLAGTVSLASAEEIAWGDVAADGSLETRSLDVPVAMARGAENFFISDPMDSHDWFHTAVVRNSLRAESKAPRTSGASAKVAKYEEEMKPIFDAMRKDADGRVNNGTARYVLHRLFSDKYGWSVKGLQPAGAAWLESQSVTPDVKDVTKYIVPTYIQDLHLAQSGTEGFDLHSLAVIAATIRHLVHSEIISLVYGAFMTLELPVPGKRSEQQVDEILDTFMMVYGFGLNLEVSVAEDVQKAKDYLRSHHGGWPQLQVFIRDVRNSFSATKELDFDQIVQVAEKIGEGYAHWQGKDCSRVKDELTAKPSFHDGRVLLSEVQPSHVAGRRSLFTESKEDLEKLGVLYQPSSDAPTFLVISNYINSQSMCLSTASFHAACCVNECEGILAKLERATAAPAAKPDDLVQLMKSMPGPGIAEGILQEIPNLADQNTGLVELHGRGLAGWMHRAFPLECPAPDIEHNQKVTNPKTPDEWISDTDQVKELEEMMGEIAQVLAQYTTMGHKDGEEVSATESASDPERDIVRIRRIHPPGRFNQAQPQASLLGRLFYITAMLSMMVLVVVAARSLSASSTSKVKAFLSDLV